MTESDAESDSSTSSSSSSGSASSSGSGSSEGSSNSSSTRASGNKKNESKTEPEKQLTTEEKKPQKEVNEKPEEKAEQAPAALPVDEEKDGKEEEEEKAEKKEVESGNKVDVTKENPEQDHGATANGRKVELSTEAEKEVSEEGEISDKEDKEKPIEKPSDGRKRSKTASPRNRRKRSRSRSRSRRRRTRSRSRSPVRHRSSSLERRRQQRQRRHEERDKQDEKRAQEREERHRRKDDRNDRPVSKERHPRPRSRSRNRSSEKTTTTNDAGAAAKTSDDSKEKLTERQRRTVDLLTSRTGGAYIPPAKLRLMQAEITDKASAAYQRIAWEALKKSIHGYINKVNVTNIAIITRELIRENIVRGRGLLCRSIIQAQAASPTFTHVYAALVAIINSKFPNIGELLLKRLIIQFRRAFRRNDKFVCMSATRFIAHLVNQRVAHEILALEILTLLVETPTDDSVEVAIGFLKECGMKLTEVSSKGIGAIFEMLRNILHEGKLEKRVQYMIEVLFQVRKDGFKDHPAITSELELVEEDDQFTHLMMLDEATTTEDVLNVFKLDDCYEENEDKYKGLCHEILGSDASGSGSGSSSGSDDDDSESGSGDEEEGGKTTTAGGEIIDNTETNVIALRRTIYLTITSSLEYEECAHKLMKMQLKPGQEVELCHMLLDCCAEQRTYEKFYGLLAQRFCNINKIYVPPFEEIFKDTYQTTHRLDTNRLRNVSKFFAHLLITDAISWDVLECIKLNEDDTTSSSRIFVKILFQELAEYLGLGKLNTKLKEEVLVESLAGLFPKDNPRNTRFSINFFTSIGLGGLTDDLRRFLKTAPKAVPAINAEIIATTATGNPFKEGEVVPVKSSSSSSSSSSSDSDSESSSSESSEPQRKRKKTKTKKSSSKKKTKKSKKNKKQKDKEKEKEKEKERSKEKRRKKKELKKKSKKKRKEESSSSSSSSGSESSSSSSSDSSSSASEAPAPPPPKLKRREPSESDKPSERVRERDSDKRRHRERRDSNEFNLDEPEAATNRHQHRQYHQHHQQSNGHGSNDRRRDRSNDKSRPHRRDDRESYRRRDDDGREDSRRNREREREREQRRDHQSSRRRVSRNRD